MVLAGHKPGEVAKQFHVSRTSVYKWVRRWRGHDSLGGKPPISRLAA
ncbi:MAG: Helix-turn-helix domain [Frankiales bacterium]|jgi:transposase|nr:Helix-turn-helix domain [Frankiales bacterium]